MCAMNVLSLCAGIEGFGLGIKRAIPEALFRPAESMGIMSQVPQCLDLFSFHSWAKTEILFAPVQNIFSLEIRSRSKSSSSSTMERETPPRSYSGLWFVMSLLWGIGNRLSYPRPCRWRRISSSPNISNESLSVAQAERLSFWISSALYELQLGQGHERFVSA